MDPGPYSETDRDLPHATYLTVVVRPGDTLFQIADRYDSSVARVAELNKLSDQSRIYPGQTLRVPASSETREAVLGEATNASEHNYAPPPKPIDANKFNGGEDVAVRDLPPVDSMHPAKRVASSTTSHAAATPPSQPAGQQESVEEASAGRFAWPVTGQVISPFGTKANGERNDGINIAAASGTPIHAAASGTVTYAGNELKGYGNLVLIQHDDGYVTAYAHAETVSVTRGDHVERGQVIGLAGETGDVDRPQLHFEIRRGVQPINPRLLLASNR